MLRPCLKVFYYKVRRQKDWERYLIQEENFEKKTKITWSRRNRKTEVDIYRGGLLEDIKYCVRKEKVKNRRKLTFGLISGIILQCKGH